MPFDKTDGNIDRWFLQQLDEAVTLKKKQADNLEKHEATLDKELVKQWVAEIQEWDKLANKKGAESQTSEPEVVVVDEASA